MIFCKVHGCHCQLSNLIILSSYDKDVTGQYKFIKLAKVARANKVITPFLEYSTLNIVHDDNNDNDVCYLLP